MRRRSAIEPVIGHLKADHRMRRNQLAHTQGEAANTNLAAVGYDFRQILSWIKILLVILWAGLQRQTRANPSMQIC
jgi:IS5 family transposase